MGRGTTAWHLLRAAEAEALAPADSQNTAGERQLFEGFVVRMHLAWLWLLRAALERDRVDAATGTRWSGRAA